MKRSYIYIASALAAIVPAIAFAATGSTLLDVVDLIIYYANVALVLLMALAVVVFVWFVIKYFILPNENRKEAGLYVMYSVIGFFVILSFWGLVNILENTFGLQNERNTPGSWASFTSIFPHGGSSSNIRTTYGTTGNANLNGTQTIYGTTGNSNLNGGSNSNYNPNLPDCSVGYDPGGCNP